VNKNKASKQNRNNRREELLRPSRYLGYDRDELGKCLLSRGAHKIAESQFRRAMWLNPFEVRFVCHLAWCLYKEGRYHEAKQYIEQVDVKCIEMDEDTRIIIDRIKQKVL